MFFWCAWPLAADSIKITEQTVSLSGVPESWKSLRIALISDLHLTEKNCMRSPFPELPEKLNGLDPDIILIAGDVFHGMPAESADAMRKAFSSIFSKVRRPPLGIYAVCGNHDELPGVGNVRAVLKDSGVIDPGERLLEIPFPGGTFRLTSITGAAGPVLPAHLRGDRLKNFAPCLILTHYPDNFTGIPDDLPVLMTAGHTHGGLIHIPGLDPGAAYRMYTKKNIKYVYGLYREGKKVLFVTAGLGGENSSRYRINNPPEIVLLRFR